MLSQAQNRVHDVSRQPVLKLANDFEIDVDWREQQDWMPMLMPPVDGNWQGRLKAHNGRQPRKAWRCLERTCLGDAEDERCQQQPRLTVRADP